MLVTCGDTILAVGRAAAGETAGVVHIVAAEGHLTEKQIVDC